MPFIIFIYFYKASSIMPTTVHNPNLGSEIFGSHLLPAGIDEAYPLEASRLESLRRVLLDELMSEGYSLCMPPLIEFIDTLIDDVGSDVNLATFKLTDQLSGKMMGIRSDMTPQIARMDYQMSHPKAISRLCYIGSVLKTRPDNFGGTRSPIQLGAEIYGSHSHNADLEIILLMISTLKKTGLTQKITLDIGHLSVFNMLLERHQLSSLSTLDYHQLFNAVDKKAPHNLPAFLDNAAKANFLNLLKLSGNVDVLLLAKKYFPDFSAVDEVISLCNQISQFYPDINIHVDFTELRGHRYYTGLIFGAFVADCLNNNSGQAVALGGRYNDIGKHLGYKRPAVGFSTDLRKLLNFFMEADSPKKIILAPVLSQFDSTLEKVIANYRAAGDIVIRDLGDLTDTVYTHRMYFDAQLSTWLIE